MIANYIKVAFINLAYAITLAYDPFEKPTRPLQVKYAETLSVKSKKFEKDFIENFSMIDNAIWRNNITTINDDIDIGDQMLWHGVATAMWAMKYRDSGDTNSLYYLKRSLVGMDLQQRFDKEETRRLVRGVRPDGTWQDDVSNDQATGHLLGIAYAYRFGDADCMARATALIRGFADELINNNYCLINEDKTPTKHGKLINGILTDPLRLTLTLATFSVAHNITGDPKYLEHYESLYEKYRPLVKYPKVKLLWIDTKYDTHRAAIHLSLLADNEPVESSRYAAYCKGMKNIWKLESKVSNTWVAFLLAKHIEIPAEDMQACKKMLQEFTFEDKQYNTEKINSNRTDISTVTWGGEVMSKQPLPRWQVGAQDFFWQRNLRAVDEWVGNKNHWQRYNGLDFLAAYWMGRLNGFISKED